MILKIIDKLLEECLVGCKKERERILSYLSIMQVKTESLIIELKKKSFDLDN